MTALPDGSVVRKLPVIPDEIAELHWSEALQAAKRLDEEAAELAERAKERSRMAIAVRLRAERERDGEEAQAPKPDLTDSLLAAAGLAVEDLEPGFQPVDLAGALAIKDTRRALALLLALEQLGHVRREGKGALVRWAAVDPMETVARDFARQQGRFHVAELAEHLQVPIPGAEHYIRLMVARGQIHRPGTDGSTAWEWLKAQPERAVTRRPRRLPPEAEAVAKVGDLAPRRGEVVEGTGQAIGASHRPMLDSDRKKRGKRIRRRKTQGYSR